MPFNGNSIPPTARRAGIFFLLAACGLATYLITFHTISNIVPAATSRKSTPTPAGTTVFPEDRPITRVDPDGRARSHSDLEAINAGAIPNRRIFIFKDDASLARFIANLPPGVKLLGKIDRLKALQVSFSGQNDLAALGASSSEASFVFPVTIPEISGPPAQPGAIPLGGNLLKWLGAEGDMSQWGKGVKIAVLDTGIADHRVFSLPIERINLVALPENPADLNGHGTAVASLIFSSNPFAPGVAPGATPLSIRISNDAGESDSFLIAQGITAAVDAGASFINLSMGGVGHSALVDQSVDYATAHGVVIIAAAGNGGANDVLQPAAHHSVLSIGGVDGRNDHLAFSNYSDRVDFAAPGYGINVAYPGDTAATVDGTSFSTPIITGSLAFMKSNPVTGTTSSFAAVELLNSSLKDVGAQGRDPFTGAGVPDLWRVLNRNNPSASDIGITSITRSGNSISVLVQNLGNTTAINTGLSISTNGVTSLANITTLTPGQSRAITIPAAATSGLNIHATVQPSAPGSDQRSSNDGFSTKFTPIGP